RRDAGPVPRDRSGALLRRHRRHAAADGDPAPARGPAADRRDLPRAGHRGALLPHAECAHHTAPRDRCADELCPAHGPHAPQRRRLTGPEEHQLLQGSRVIGGARTVAGMVAGNEPFRAAPKRAGALAAATATGAFGIFYNSIWSMSMYLPTPRLLLIGLLAMLVITTWLIVGNRLWDEPKHERLAPVVLLYNLSTVLTLLMMVGLLYALLVVLIFGSSLIVIAPDYLAEVTQREPVLTRYLDIAWLSAAMGVVAGALGSSFDNDTELRNLTHGQRERQRRFAEESGE